MLVSMSLSPKTFELKLARMVTLSVTPEIQRETEITDLNVAA